jgi:hypothetical protein
MPTHLPTPHWPTPIASAASAKYWESVPQAEFDAMVKEMEDGNIKRPAGKAVQFKVDARMAAAGKQLDAGEVTAALMQCRSPDHRLVSKDKV